MSLPLRPEMCIFTNNSSGSGINTGVTPRIISLPSKIPPQRSIPYHWTRPLSVHAETNHAYVKKKSNFLTIDRYGGTVYDTRCIKPYSLWLLSVFQSLPSQSGFQNSAWGHFKTQHWSLSVAWLRTNTSLRSFAVDCGGPIKIPTEVWLCAERRSDEANGGKKGGKTVSKSRGKTYCVFI